MTNYWHFSTLLLLFPLSVHALGLGGRVMEQEQPVTEAQVLLTTAESDVLLKQGKTSAKGEYRFSVEPGSYNLKAMKKGYTGAWARGVTVTDADVVVNIELAPAVFTDETQGAESDDCD